MFITILSLAAISCGSVEGAEPDAMPDAFDGPTCEEYCTTNLAACTAFPQYTSQIECVSYCENFGQIPAGTDADQSGNTIGCRTYHSTVASTVTPDVHCPHSGRTGGDTCGSWCENYCHLAQLNCTGSEALYSTDSECLSVCSSNIPAIGQAGDTTGNTVQCRIHQLGLAGTEPPGSQTMYCPAGRVNDDTFCFD